MERGRLTIIVCVALVFILSNWVLLRRSADATQPQPEEQKPSPPPKPNQRPGIRLTEAERHSKKMLIQKDKEIDKRIINSPCGPVTLNYDLPTVALASYPRSGNTLTRHLLEEATGYATGSIYHPDVKGVNRGLYGEDRILGTVVVKSHSADKKLFRLSDYVAYNNTGYPEVPLEKILLLVRNPFDSLFSYFHFAHTEIMNKTLSTYSSEDLGKYTTRIAKDWRSFVSVWMELQIGYPTLFVRYEDLTSNFCGELARMLDFLLPYTSPHSTESCRHLQSGGSEDLKMDRLACAVRENSKCNHAKDCRAAEPMGASLSKYTNEQVKIICGIVGDYMQLFGYPIQQCGTLTPSADNLINQTILDMLPVFPNLPIVEKNP